MAKMRRRSSVMSLHSMTMTRGSDDRYHSVPDFCVPDGQLSCAAWSFWRASKSVEMISEMISDEGAAAVRRPAVGL